MKKRLKRRSISIDSIVCAFCSVIWPTIIERGASNIPICSLFIFVGPKKTRRVNVLSRRCIIEIMMYETASRLHRRSVKIYKNSIIILNADNILCISLSLHIHKLDNYLIRRVCAADSQTRPNQARATCTHACGMRS